MENRTVALYTEDGFVSHTLERGCPQGSCSGPLFWNIALDPLLHLQWNPQVQLMAYANDLMVLVSDKKPETISTIAADTLYRINWLIDNDLQVEASMSVFLWPNKRKKRPAIRIGNERIRSSCFIKYLGIYIDQELSFCHHANFLQQKLHRTLQSIRRIAGARWDFSRHMRNILHKSISIRQVAYGALAWFSTPETRLRNKVDSLQRPHLLQISGAYRNQGPGGRHL